MLCDKRKRNEERERKRKTTRKTDLMTAGGRMAQDLFVCFPLYAVREEEEGKWVERHGGTRNWP